MIKIQNIVIFAIFILRSIYKMIIIDLTADWIQMTKIILIESDSKKTVENYI